MNTETDTKIRWLNIHLITALKFSTITDDCMEISKKMCTEANPLLRRLSLISIISYLKFKPQSSFDFKSLIQKFMNDPHPLVFSTVFYALSEVKDFLINSLS